VTRSDGSQVDVAVDIRTEVGEGPHWDATTLSLWFVDLTRGTVCRYDRVTGSVTTFSPGQEVGAVLPRRAGGLVLAVRDGIASASETGDGFRLEVPVERENIGNRMNDAKCDPVGRLFAGTTAFDFATGAGALYRIDLDWSCEAVVRGVSGFEGAQEWTTHRMMNELLMAKVLGKITSTQDTTIRGLVEERNTLKEKVDSLERVLKEKGLTSSGDLDNYSPPAEKDIYDDDAPIATKLVVRR